MRMEMKPRLYDKYQNEIKPALKEQGGYENVHQIPRIEKIVLNMGVSATLEKDALADAVKDMTMITGRKPVTTKAKKSVANFNLRGVAAHSRLPGHFRQVVRRPRQLFPRRQ